jgi:cellulose synthase (UDP-forming)
MAAELGVNYLWRDKNTDFKAGNLNHALTHLMSLERRSEFLAVFDADFIVKTRFLERVVALMRDPDVAIVQTPQHFYNSDPFQLSFRAQRCWPDDQRFLFDVLLPALDARGAALCCGTSFLLRVSHLLSIGGFPTESICEDTLMSYKLAQRGLQTIYLNEALSHGLSPEGLGEYLKQRFRWCLGTMQCIASRWGPGQQSSSLWKRFQNRALLYRWGYFSFMRYAWMSVPLLHWFFGVSVIWATVKEALPVMLPLAAVKWGTAWLTGARSLPVVTEAADLLASFSVLPATVRWLCDPTKYTFQVTQKGTNRREVRIQWAVLRWIGLLVAVQIVGICYASTDPYGSPDIRLWNYTWAYYALLVLSVALVPCFEPARQRLEERFRCVEGEASVRVRERDQRGGQAMGARLVDVSVGGALLTFGDRLPTSDEIEVTFASGLTVGGRIVRRGARRRCGVAWQGTEDVVDRLTLEIFAGDGYRLSGHPWSGLLSILAVARRWAF